MRPFLSADACVGTGSQERLDVPIPAEIGGVHQRRIPGGILPVDVCAVLSKEGNHPAVRLHEDGGPKDAVLRILGRAALLRPQLSLMSTRTLVISSELLKITGPNCLYA